MAAAEDRAAQAFADAHRALLADPSVQFRMGPVTPPKPPPAWLQALEDILHRLFAPLGRLLDRLFGWLPPGPWARILLWGVLALAGAFVVAMVAIRLREGNWRWPRRRRVRTVALEPAAQDGWVPEAAPARALLAEADALADAGRFDEAVHLLLRRSVEDIAQRRPQLARPSLTSRDLAADAAVPPAPRALFGGIAQAVERSLFGGRPLGADDWQQARAAYADFALPRGWSARAAA